MKPASYFRGEGRGRFNQVGISLPGVINCGVRGAGALFQI